MQNYIRLYLDYFGYGEQDIIFCEKCGMKANDIHHVFGRGKGKDIISNLMALCRSCHNNAHLCKISKQELQTIHNNFIKRHEKRI